MKRMIRKILCWMGQHVKQSNKDSLHPHECASCNRSIPNRDEEKPSLLERLLLSFAAGVLISIMWVFFALAV